MQDISRKDNTTAEADDVVLTDRIEAALKRVSKRALQYEYQMRALEIKLAENLGNFRTVEGMLHKAFGNINRNSRRANQAMIQHLPTMSNELDESMEALEELKQKLPLIRSQLADVRYVYDTNREKAKALISDLTWLNTDFYTRWKTIIFTTSSPVSWRWKVLMRTIFLVAFTICFWLAWISLRGVYRAHRQRLVWGERLMS